ncbi:MAG: VOC family protein [Shewanella sp.]|nr:VOC family protein [Shewanella sp.]MCF1430516.1 VOC family protein [Shewanella sp.]MCF1438628.1 VOC family protein [Shewanella sp.]MCF1457427.1 VOC family protein [Shewanella sp.]
MSNQPALNIHALDTCWPNFSNAIEAFISRLGLSHLQLTCDHAALRVNDTDTASRLADEFATRGRIISNNIINGRPILIIKLNKPLMLGQQAVDCVELPFPGDKHYPQQGWEHVELVLPVAAVDCDALGHALTEQVPDIAQVLSGHTEINVKLSSPRGEHERLPNPTIAFKHRGLCVKIHAHSIETVIASEQGC